MNGRLVKKLLVCALAGQLLIFGACDKGSGSDGGQVGGSAGESGAPVSETAEADTPGEVKLGEYKGLSVQVEALLDVTEEDVAQAVRSAVENATVTKEITDREIAAGDTVNVSYTGYLEDEEIPDSAVEDYNLLIGSGIFFNGAENQLIGVMPGETVDISVTYPEGYPKAELVGKTAVYKVTVHAIVEETRAELTDAFVATISDCKTVAEFEAMTRDMLVESRENERILARRSGVWDAVMENAQVISYSSKDVSAITDLYQAYDQSAADDFGMTLEAYVKEYQGLTLEAYHQELETLAKLQLKEKMVVEAIAEAENINSENITEEEITRCSREQGYESAQAYKDDRSEEDMKMDVLTNRVKDFVVESADITEV